MTMSSKPKRTGKSTNAEEFFNGFLGALGAWSLLEPKIVTRRDIEKYTIVTIWNAHEKAIAEFRSIWGGKRASRNPCAIT